MELSKVLWWPIEDRLSPHIRRLLVRPDGNLGQLPFSALRGRDGRALCSRCDVILRSAHAHRERGLPPDLDYLVVGDPAPARGWHDRWRLALSMFTGQYPRVLPTGTLRNARAEARAIASMLETAGRFKGRCLIGPNASREAIVNGPRAKIMHFAMHGFSLARQNTAGSPRESAVIGHPDHDWRAGLVCAGARAWRSRNGALGNDDDGLLLARDISLLDLDGVQLVVLAACDTSFGEPVPGEGIVALADAFLGAGARSVIAAGWALDDADTTQLMQEMYTRLLAGDCPERALRAVQSSWSDAGRHQRLVLLALPTGLEPVFPP